MTKQPQQRQMNLRMRAEVLSQMLSQRLIHSLFVWQPTQDWTSMVRRAGERDRRLLRQHRDTYKGPNLRNKPRRWLKHQTQLDSICEKVEEEDDRSKNQRTLQKDGKVSAVTDSEGKEEIANVGMMRIAQITRERTRKKPWRQPVNARRIKIDRNTGAHANCGLRITKWWTMIASIQPYTCAANRYAKFRSNRRFKPGD